MNKKQKLDKLMALKENMLATQVRLKKAKKLDEALHATNIGILLEAELEQAEIILATKDFLAQLQKMAEELANMQADSIPLGDNMKEVFGPEVATAFENSVTTALQDGLVAIRSVKDEVSSAIMRVEGKDVPDASMGSDMGDDFGGDDSGDDFGGDDSLDLGGMDDAGSDDAFGGATASAGPVDEPLGRARKESYDLKSIGKKLLMRESLEGLVSWLMEDVAPTMSMGQLPKFAGQIAMKGAQDQDRLAGWIGKRKYGAGIGAQLSNPLDDMDADVLDEGKSYKKNDEDGDAKGKKKASVQKSAASKSKRDIDEGKKEEDDFVSRQNKAKLDKVEEGKSFKKNDDEDTEGKKKSSMTKSEKAKSKRSIEEAVRLIIERNIAKGGKGFAAKAIAEAQSMFPMLENADAAYITKAFLEAYGMTPQAYSVKKARIVSEDVPLNPQDKKNAATAMAKVAGQMGTDKGAGDKPITTATAGMSGTERSTVNKIVQNAKASGKPVVKVKDLVNQTNTDLEENINAANWPINSKGQYKGEPFQTDHDKLKANKTSSDSKSVPATPKPDSAKSTTPWDGEKTKSESPKTSDGKTASTKPAAPSTDGVKKEKAPKTAAEPKEKAESSSEEDKD